MLHRLLPGFRLNLNKPTAILLKYYAMNKTNVQRETNASELVFFLVKVTVASFETETYLSISALSVAASCVFVVFFVVVVVGLINKIRIIK